MTTKPTKDPLAEMAASLDHSVETWLEKNSPEAIEKRVHAKLNKHSDEIVMKLLGFDTRYGGEWVLDHCNGRAGESSASEYLRKTSAEAVNKWLSNFKPPAINKKLIDAVIKESEWPINRLLKYLPGNAQV